ncbi:LysR family transcriptional regulator [Nocardiopsis chromatogenes]|uniref:LysR family transcriptional regulator n=1 Tax=Nocardiopsis chromatogenes TaxID=280239 RepID=UPI0003493378|nr:LysR family transcriptional regulator [Nocardiopsis chromatogenes]
MELQQMRYVVAVAEEHNFTRAAERCRVVQSALSHQVARLERELGTRLFERTSRRVRLTPAGEAFLPAARQALEAAERARAEAGAAAGEVRGRLRLGAIPTVTAVDLPALLGRFRERYPKAGVALRTIGSEVMIEQVRRGELDAALLGVPIDMQVPGLRMRELATNRLVAIVAPAHPLAGRGRVGLREVAAEVFIDFPAGSAGRAQSDQAFAAAGLHREVAFEVSGADMMVRLVREGVGVGMLPEPFVPGLEGLAAVAVSDAPVRAERLVWGPMPPSPAAAAFLSLLEESLGGG